MNNQKSLCTIKYTSVPSLPVTIDCTVHTTYCIVYALSKRSGSQMFIEAPKAKPDFSISNHVTEL